MVAELGGRIVGGHYESSAVLPRADTLAAELGVSRTVVREATRVLSEKGLVESRQRIGTRVRARLDWDLLDPEVIAWQRSAGPDMRFFRELSEVRMAIETTAARLAAERATPRQVARMRDHFVQMERGVDDPAEYVRADLVLHEEFFVAADNALLTQLEHTLSEGLVASRDVTVRSPGASARALPMHLDVIESIAAHDSESSAAAMTILLQQALHDIEATMATLGELVPITEGRT